MPLMLPLQRLLLLHSLLQHPASLRTLQMQRTALKKQVATVSKVRRRDVGLSRRLVRVAGPLEMSCPQKLV
mgnify:CR=1 FL=1